MQTKIEKLKKQIAKLTMLVDTQADDSDDTVGLLQNMRDQLLVTIKEQ